MKPTYTEIKEDYEFNRRVLNVVIVGLIASILICASFMYWVYLTFSTIL